MTGHNAPQFIIMVIPLRIFSNHGVILLLFVVDLESTVEEMRQVGVKALMVAVIGVVAPFVLGYVTSYLLLPDSSTPVHLFIAATLCGTR